VQKLHEMGSIDSTDVWSREESIMGIKTACVLLKKGWGADAEGKI
jgi:hypothetical protein